MEINNNKINEFRMNIRKFTRNVFSYIPFDYGNAVRKLDLNGEFIYLWQNAKETVTEQKETSQLKH
mgnify:CR=1 FL=1